MRIKKQALINILFALTIFFYSFDGYVFYIFGLLYLMASLLKITISLNKPKIVIGILGFLLVFAVIDWGIYNLGSLNNQEIRCVFGYIMLIWFLLNLVKDANAYREIFSVILYVGIFEAACVIIEFLLPSMFLKIYGVFFPIRVEFVTERISQGYIAGFTNQVANTAFYIVMAIGIVFFTGMLKKKKGKILFIILFLALILTGKRGHLLFCVLALVLTYFFSDKNQLKPRTWGRILLLAIALCVGVYIIYNSGTSFGNRIAETVDSFLQGDDITSSRSTINVLTFSLIANNFLMGIGWGRYKYEYQSYFYSMSSGTWDQTFNAHNIYLQLMAEVGIIGTVIFVLLAAAGLIQGLRLAKHSTDWSKKYNINVQLLLFVQFFFLLYGITGNPLYEYNEYSLYFLAIALNGIIYNSSKCGKYVMEDVYSHESE